MWKPTRTRKGMLLATANRFYRFMETGIDCSFTFTRSFLGGRWKLKVVGQQSSISTTPITIPYYIRNIRIWGDLMLHISQKRYCLFECDCMVLCLHMCVIFPACKSSVFVFLVIRVPDSGSDSALQYLVPPKPTIVPACLRESVCFCVYHSWSRVHIISGSCLLVFLFLVIRAVAVPCSI